MIRHATLVVVLVAVLATATPVQGAAAPDSADGYLRAFQDLEEDPALQTYSEFEVIRSQAVVEVQAGEFSANEERRMSNVLTTLRRFSRAYSLAENGSTGAALDRANATAAAIDSLRDAGGTRYAALANLALERFYSQQGEQIRSEARATNRTSTRIRLLQQAAIAYRQAGAAEQFSTISVQSHRLRTEYRSDLRALNESTATAGSFVDSCEGTCASPVAAVRALRFGVLDRYAQARQARASARTAVELASEHGLSERSSQSNALVASARESLRSLALASALLMFAYALVVAVLAAVVVHRVVSWEDDLRAARVDSIVGSRSQEVTDA